MTSKGSSREGRGESSRGSHSNHPHNRANAVAPEPLFPRVHVSETRNGPKAPPRNKMALYEQLTVPSQHFLQRQASGSVWPPMNPAYASQYAGANLFTPCFVPPGLAFHHHSGSMDGGGAAPQSMGAPLGSQKSTVVDSELQRVPRVVDGNHPVASSATASASARPKSSSQQQQQQQHISTNGIATAATSMNTTTATANNENANNTNASSNFLTNKRVRRNEDDFAVPTYCPKDGKRVEASSSKQQQQQEQQQQHNNTNQCGKTSKDVTRSAAPPQIVERSSAGAVGVTAAAAAAPGVVISPRNRHRGHTEQICSSNICESDAGSDNQSDDSVQEQVSCDGDSNASIVDSVVKIAARDVVGAVGEKEFWKTRKTLLRQQRIFATQVFELHRVVKVQHLLAESPKLMLEPDHHTDFPLLDQAQPLRITHEVAPTNSEVRRAIQLARLPEASPPRASNKDQNAQASKTLHNLKDQHHQQKSYSTALEISPPPPPPPRGAPPPAAAAAAATTLLNSYSSSPAPPQINPSSTTTATQAMTYQTFPGAANSWGFAAFPGSSMNQWAMLPPSACQPYVFQPAPNAAPMLPGYGTAYQPVFHGAPAGSYEIFPMVPRPPQTAEMPQVYWQQPMFPGVHSSGWYAFPQQYYEPSSIQTPAPPKLQKSANSTVMSPLDLQQEQQQQQQQQQQQAGKVSAKFHGSTHNSDMSSIAQSSDYHHFQQQQQQQQHEKRGREVTQRWIEGEHQQHGVNYSMPFSYVPPSGRHEQQQQGGFNGNNGAMKVVPRAVMATPESAAGILKSIQRERR